MKNNTYTISQIKKIETCPFQGFMSTFNTRGGDNSFLHLLSLYKKAIKENAVVHGFDKFFDDNVNENYFYSNVALEIEKNLFCKNLKRMYDYIIQNKAYVIDNQGGSFIYNYNGNSIKTKYDMIIGFKDRIKVIKIITSSPKLSYSARSEENKPENNLELMLIHDGGNKMQSIAYYDKSKNKLPVIASIWHLVGKADKDKDTLSDYKLWLKGDKSSIEREINDLQYEYDQYSKDGKKREANKRQTRLKKLNSILHFDYNHGNNIISQHNFNENYILSKLDETLSIELSIDSEKCDGSYCDRCDSKAICDAKKYIHIELEELVEEVGDTDVVKIDIKPTEEQQKVIDTHDGFIRVNAACGTGKSETSAQRFKSLIDSGVKPQEILGISFTNKASEELRNRVSKRANVSEEDLRTFTFNSLGASILNNEYTLLGFNKQPKVVDNITKVEVLLSILRKPEYSNIPWLNMKYPLLNMINAKGAVYELFSAFSSMKTFTNFGNYGQSQIETLQLIFDEYNKTIWSKDKIDYQDQILLLNKLFDRNPELIERYGFAHITVDEFNDTNKMQIDLLNKLAKYSNFKSLMAIGDSSQSVFSFAGSSQEYIINFDKYFGEYADLSLTTNFRSTHQICDLANKIDRLNTIRVDKTMVSHKGIGLPVTLQEYDTSESEYKAIGELINNSDTNYPDIAILARTKAELLKLQHVLSDANIPSYVDVSELNIDNHNVKLAINLASYVANPEQNRPLLEAFLQIRSNVVSKEDIQKEFEEMNNWIKEDIEELKLNEIRNKELISEIDEDFGESIDDLSLEKNRIDLYLSLIKPLRDMDEVCDKFIEGVMKTRPFTEISDLASYLRKHIDYNDSSQIEKDEKKYNAVTLLTMHSSKGREYKDTYVVLDKLKYSDKMHIDDLEEERRLLFVACTRAKDMLHLSYQLNMDKKRGAGTYCGFADEVRRILE